MFRVKSEILGALQNGDEIEYVLKVTEGGHVYREYPKGFLGKADDADMAYYEQLKECGIISVCI